MSGDVQPRKRNKDKKRRREDSDAGRASFEYRKLSMQDDEDTRPTGVHPTKMGPDDIQLHVHSEHGTGGHWCAKIFFFSLLAILLGLIGLILLENRGLSDLDTPLSESRFADMLEGWVDEEREVHDEHDVHAPPDSHNEHDEHEDGEDNIANSQENEEDEHDEDEAELTKDDADNDDEKDEGFDESGETEDSANADNDDDENDEDENNDEDDNPADLDDDDDDENEDKEVDDNDDDEDEGIADDDKEQADDDDDNNDDSPTLDDDNDDDSPAQDDDNDDDSPALVDDGHEIDNDNDSDSPALDDDGNEIEPEPQEEDEGSSLAVRIIVGVALVLVAHQVLLKRPQTNVDDEPKATSDSETIDEQSAEFLEMKRRFTLVTAEEPIPSSDEETKETIIETIPTIAESVKTVESSQSETIVSKQNETADILYSDEDVIGASDGIELKSDYERTASTDGMDEELLSEEEAEEEEEEISSEGQNYADSEDSVDDSDLLKRLDEKYGRLPVANDEDDHDDYDIEDIDPTWTKIDRSGPAAIPTEDQLLDDEIRRANEQLAEDPQSALTQFERIRQSHPTSVAAQYGLAKALDDLADLKRSNGLLKRAIDEYGKYIDFGVKLNDTEFKSAAERCIDRMRFIGEHIRAVPIHEKLIERFDDDPYYRNQLAVTYLLVNRLADAKYVLHMTLQRWRDDGFAAVHYGFVLKNLDNNLEHAVIFLRQGIDSGENGTSDGRFYFHLGDALIRLGRHDRAKEVFKEAAKKKLFPSEYQRSLYNVNHLKAKPFWTLAETGYKHEFRTLEQNWEKIRDEGLSLLSKDGFFTDEAENLRDTGIWKQFEMFARGKRNAENCKRTPFTCKVIETFPAARFCKRGQVKFSVMHPNTHVWPHCGPTNCRLRAHLGLKTTDKTSIRVATETRTWNEGKFMVFDDSFEHEVWHNGTTYRLILIVDVWHPDLTAEEKQTLVPI
ncbi:aspartyl/asparaginyl beta-hydroxylase isoform X5 [Sitodiplosis mosellana]|uniref:aspartyl/asparaginyl beta-hydroxylase isoform X5 n=1 Tax=Sitodiplosis mosellana TaxID=263140 RepID=UPI002443805B|nr:aspartyl/asparaginyl beta-hydroxylase isoform X5 [Sitodiplosis mosellana]